jgi:hypothetical protein
MVGAAGLLSGCLEYALIQALEEDAPDDVAVDEGRFDSEIFEEGDSVVPEDPAGVDSPVDLRGGSLLGDMGRVRDFDDEDPMLRGWNADGYANLEVHAEKPDGTGVAMVIIGVTGGLEHPELRSGAHFEFNQYEYPESGLHVNLIGCSGPVEGDWAFDQGADTVTLDVSEGDTASSRVLDFTATFLAYDDWGTGTVEQGVVGSVELGATQTE